MQKFIFIILVLFLFACNKIEITEEPIKETAEQQLTEAEAWKLFDEFWLEFQKAVVEDDEEAIRSMCELDDIDFLLETISKSKILKKHIKKMTTIKNIGTFKDFGEAIVFYEDGVFTLDIIQYFEPKRWGQGVMTLRLKDKKYKLFQFNWW